MKKLNKIGTVLSGTEQKEINGGKRLSALNGYQCCNQWGCGACVTGSNMDCSTYDFGSNNEVYGQACVI